MTRSHSATLNFGANHPGRRVLVTGATGYVGGRCIPELLDAGFKVRAVSRNAKSLERFDWFDQVEPAEADLGAEDAADDLDRVMDGIDVVFYLVHSMGSDGDFEEIEQRTARNVSDAAGRAGVRQIVYLSGLHPRGKSMGELSKHMRSREKVARTLLEADTPAVVLRAATLIGSGSASFEMIRHLAERLPVMVAPQWINNKIEPISIRDALYYLVSIADLDEPVNDGFDIGGGVVYKFSDLLKLYAQTRGLKRYIGYVPLPLPADHLSGAWIGLVTPVPAKLAVPLAASMAEDAITADHRIANIVPDPPEGLADYPTSVERALHRELHGGVPTSWDDSWKKPSDPADRYPTDPDWAGTAVHQDLREIDSSLPPEKIWPIIESIGGPAGWYSTPALWRVRGVMDKFFGGPGLGGRRDPRKLKVGDRVDWWRVESIEPPHRLVLRAEMKLDGKAWLILEAREKEGGGSTYVQRAVYVPAGLLGHAYWYAVLPFHAVVFPFMSRNILRAAEDNADDQR